MEITERDLCRFWSKVNKTDYCWEWTGWASLLGYGKFVIKNVSFSAHRISWLIHFGDIPEGLCVLHKCDNRRCIRSNHLFLGTHKDNTQDMYNKNRQGSKLTEDIVLKIRSMYECGISQKEIMDYFDIPRTTIYSIVHRKTWVYI